MPKRLRWLFHSLKTTHDSGTTNTAPEYDDPMTIGPSNSLIPARLVGQRAETLVTSTACHQDQDQLFTETQTVVEPVVQGGAIQDWTQVNLESKPKYAIGVRLWWNPCDRNSLQIPCVAMDCAYFSPQKVSRKDIHQMIGDAIKNGDLECPKNSSWMVYVRMVQHERWADRWVPEHTLSPRGENVYVTGSSSSELDVSVGRKELNEDVLLHEEHVYEVLHRSNQILMNPTWTWKKAWLDRRRECESRWRSSTAIRNIDVIYLGNKRIHAHYFSPYPITLLRSDISVMYICDRCFAYGWTPEAYAIHESEHCRIQKPRGDEIYRDILKNGTQLRLFELDGRDTVASQQCQYLCLLGKLFLDHKTIITEVEDFVFYVLCEHDARGSHVVGFFSKECEVNVERNNLACLVVLPPYQGRGYGRLLVEVSYEMSKREKRPGTPELPLTPAARATYLSFWSFITMKELSKMVSIPNATSESKEIESSEAVDVHSSLSKTSVTIPSARTSMNVTLTHLSFRTGMIEHDLLITLLHLKLLDVPSNEIRLTPQHLVEHEKARSKIRAPFDPSKLHWRW